MSVGWLSVALCFKGIRDRYNLKLNASVSFPYSLLLLRSFCSFCVDAVVVWLRTTRRDRSELYGIREWGCLIMWNGSCLYACVKNLTMIPRNVPFENEALIDIRQQKFYSKMPVPTLTRSLIFTPDIVTVYTRWWTKTVAPITRTAVPRFTFFFFSHAQSTYFAMNVSD